MEGHLTADTYDSRLLSLYSAQKQITTDDYLEAHSHNAAVLQRDTSIFERCSRFIPKSGSVLDWGCNHAPTACLVKMLRGDAVQLHGCDVHEDKYDAFFDFSGLNYSRLDHPYLLPYEDDSFDAVMGTATLEHVPNDARSLDEMYRVIKPGGFFIMTTLPNHWSYTEWINRTLRKPHHLRRYCLKQVEQMFLHHGFVPVDSGYHQIFPSMCAVGGIFESRFLNSLAGSLASQNARGEKLWPIRCFASNLFMIGKKVSFIDNRDHDIGRRY